MCLFGDFIDLIQGVWDEWDRLEHIIPKPFGWDMKAQLLEIIKYIEPTVLSTGDSLRAYCTSLYLKLSPLVQ